MVAWRNRDKLATAWLHCLPGPGGLNNPAFSEALALALCMPSPACKDRVGYSVGSSNRGAVVDLYGDKVQAAVMTGDHWRIRHDAVKLEISSLCAWAKVEHTTEVFGLFSPVITAQALTRYERGRQRQGLVPDFRIKTTNITGASRHQLAELKIISCSESWYAPSAGGKVRGTDKRANGLPADYRRKARDVDREARAASGDQRGPVERKLEEYGDLLGLVFGVWGEASEGVHTLIEQLATSRLDSRQRTRGRPGNKQELGLIRAQIHRRLSLAAVKAQVECLLSRLHQVGPGSKAMQQRREWEARENEMMKREQQAQWLRKIEGIQTLRKGAILTA